MTPTTRTDTPSQLERDALDYHEYPTPGKISVTPTKPLANQRDLSLAYSPGVAYACTAIQHDPQLASRYTARGNLVAVVTNGTAVLGLGNIGALAGKPVMEGKGCLFKKFAGIDVFDIELNETDPDKLVEIVAALEPTFGGINLEDIKAPECFTIEKKLRERMRIPVFHDDQHGTAIVAAAATLNGLKIVGKAIGDVKLVCSGAGAAAIACLDLQVSLGLKRENVFVCDSKGVIARHRTDRLDPDKQRYLQDTDAKTLGDVIGGADVFLGLSGPGVLTAEMVARMGDRPIILAMANPDPEIRPEDAKAVRPDCLIGTGRSDYPNQVNNSLCFPFIFRGALDCGARTINEEMKVAAVHALAELAQAEPSDVVAQAYGEATPAFGPDYLIPRAFDPRLITIMAPAVAKAAMDSGVAERPIDDFDAYRARLSRFVYHSGMTMGPVFAAAKRSKRKVVYAEGEDERMLRAAQIVVDEKMAVPILVGRADVIERQARQLGLRLRPGVDCEVFAAPDDRSPTLIGAMLVRSGDADAMLCGTAGLFKDHLQHVRDVVGLRQGVRTMAVMQMLILQDRQLFICDTHVNREPDAAALAEIADLAARDVQRLGVSPSVAMVSHSSFGSSDSPSATRMRDALELILANGPDYEVDGEMRADAALSKAIRQREFPHSRLSADANLLIMPNVDAANITYNALRVTAGGGITVGGILLGAAQPVHILTPSSTVRRIVNMTAVAVADARAKAGAGVSP